MQEENLKDSLPEESKVEAAVPAETTALDGSKTEATAPTEAAASAETTASEESKAEAAAPAETTASEESKAEAIAAAPVDNTASADVKADNKTDKWEILQYVGLGLCGLQLIITVIFAVLCYRSVLPKDIVFFGTSVLILMVAAFTLLQRWRIPGIVSKVVSVILSVVLIIGCNYVYATNKGIGTITDNPNKHTDEISVFVKSDSGITELRPEDNHIVGLMKNTYGTVEQAVKEYEVKYHIEINPVVYSSASELFTALMNDDINVAICDSEVLGLLVEAEGFEELGTIVTEIASTEVTVIVSAEGKPVGTPKPVGGVIPTAYPTGAAGVTLPPSETPVVTQDPSVDATPTPKPTKKLNYLTYDPYVPYTEYHTGNDHVFTVLINGVDNEKNGGMSGRGDVNIMITINTKTHQIFMVTIQRDAYLPISCFNWQYDKLTHATSIGGVQAAMDTLTNLYGVNCDYYFRVNFTGAVQLIDAIGGVTVNSDSSFTTYNGYKITKGPNTLNGTQALGFVRTRYGVSGGEASRGLHQMEVIRAAIEKCTHSTTLLTNYSQIMAAAGKNMKTSMPEKMISSLISNQISTLQGWDVVSYNVTDSKTGSYASYALKANAWMSIPDYNSVGKAREYFSQIYHDQIIKK